MRVISDNGAEFDASKPYIVGERDGRWEACLQWRQQLLSGWRQPQKVVAYFTVPPTFIVLSRVLAPPESPAPPTGLEPHSALPSALPAAFGLPGDVLPEGLRHRTHGLASSIVSRCLGP